jgi:DNA-binding NtrC family response regulator
VTSDIKTILVVDDDPAIQSFLKIALMDEGYEVLVAENGAVALEIIARTPPNVVILDMKMPIMDGWAFLKHYCEQVQHPAPVISMSAAVGAPVIVECASSSIPKPFNLDTLIDLVAQYTKER